MKAATGVEIFKIQKLFSNDPDRPYDADGYGSNYNAELYNLVLTAA